MARLQPRYLETYRSGGFAAKIDEAREHLTSCRLCPRCCDVDRLHGEVGICKVGADARVATAFPYFGEQECLRGSNGSGAIFFAGCSLRCVFCLNEELAWGDEGRDIGVDELTGVLLALQERWCHSVSLVGAHQVVPQVLDALGAAIERGFRLPLVYDSSGYEAVETVELFDGIVDIWMPDFKVWDAERARRLVGAADYPEVARAAIRAMHRQVGDLELDDDGLATSGLLVRHLLLPDGLADAEQIFAFLADEISPQTYVHVMGSYEPSSKVAGDARYADIDRRVTRDEIERAREAARGAGLHRLGSLAHSAVSLTAPAAG